jgi:hypothetical protein
MGWLTWTADHSKLSLAAAGALAVFGGPDGRRAATGGLAAVGVTATLVNVGLKLVARRRRPDPVAAAVPITRQVKMPATSPVPGVSSLFAEVTSLTRTDRRSYAPADCRRNATSTRER